MDKGKGEGGVDNGNRKGCGQRKGWGKGKKGGMKGRGEEERRERRGADKEKKRREGANEGKSGLQKGGVWARLCKSGMGKYSITWKQREQTTSIHTHNGL